MGRVVVRDDGLEVKRWGRTTMVPWTMVRGARVDGAGLLRQRLVLVRDDGRKQPLIHGFRTRAAAARLNALRSDIDSRGIAHDPAVAPEPPGSWNPPISLRPSWIVRLAGWAVVVALVVGGLFAVALHGLGWVSVPIAALVLAFGVWSVFIDSHVTADEAGLTIGGRFAHRRLSWSDVSGFVPLAEASSGAPRVLIGRNDSTTLSLWRPRPWTNAARRAEWRSTIARMEYLRRTYRA